MRPSPYDQWGVCPVLGWRRVRTCHSSPNYLSHGVFSRSNRRADGFGGGNPGDSRHLGAGARARRGPGSGAGCPGGRSRLDG